MVYRALARPGTVVVGFAERSVPSNMRRRMLGSPELPNLVDTVVMGWDRRMIAVWGLACRPL